MEPQILLRYKLCQPKKNKKKKARLSMESHGVFWMLGGQPTLRRNTKLLLYSVGICVKQVEHLCERSLIPRRRTRPANFVFANEELQAVKQSAKFKC
jgi:hypothetical protein